MYEMLYVGNLSYETVVEDLYFVFADYGNPSWVQLPTDRETGRLRGFALVKVGLGQGQAAINALNGAEWMGKNMVVREATPDEKKPYKGVA